QTSGSLGTETASTSLTSTLDYFGTDLMSCLLSHQWTDGVQLATTLSSHQTDLQISANSLTLSVRLLWSDGNGLEPEQVTTKLSNTLSSIIKRMYLYSGKYTISLDLLSVTTPISISSNIPDLDERSMFCALYAVRIEYTPEDTVLRNLGARFDTSARSAEAGSRVNQYYPQHLSGTYYPNPQQQQQNAMQ